MHNHYLNNNWQEALWFEIDVVANNNDLGLKRVLKPAGFVPETPNRYFLGLKPSIDFLVEYDVPASISNIEQILSNSISEDDIKLKAEAAAIATENMIHNISRVSQETIDKFIAVNKGDISSSSPHNELIFYARVSKNEGKYNVHVFQSEGKGFIDFGKQYDKYVVDLNNIF